MVAAAARYSGYVGHEGQLVSPVALRGRPLSSKGNTDIWWSVWADCTTAAKPSFRPLQHLFVHQVGTRLREGVRGRRLARAPHGTHL